jgi:uncharacterized membrane protein YhhN
MRPIRLVGVGYLIVAGVMLWMATETPTGSDLVFGLVLVQASAGLLIGAFGTLLALRPDQVDWTLDDAWAPYTILAIAMGGLSVALLGVVLTGG